MLAAPLYCLAESLLGRLGSSVHKVRIPVEGLRCREEAHGDSDGREGMGKTSRIVVLCLEPPRASSRSREAVDTATFSDFIDVAQALHCMNLLIAALLEYTPSLTARHPS
jgi:hypothetical protein